MDKMTVSLFALMVFLITAALYIVIKEVNFDWTQCTATEEIRERHRAAWVQMTKVGQVTVMTPHPARDWTERKWICPKGEKWREIE